MKWTTVAAAEPEMPRLNHCSAKHRHKVHVHDKALWYAPILRWQQCRIKLADSPRLSKIDFTIAVNVTADAAASRMDRTRSDRSASHESNKRTMTTLQSDTDAVPVSLAAPTPP